MKRTFTQTALLSIFLFAVAEAFPDSTTTISPIVATVGSTQISYKQFKDRYEDYLVYTGIKDNRRARYAILNNMINEVLLRQYDDNSKVYSNPEYKKEISWARKEAVLAFLKDQEVYKKITVSDQELRTAYQRSKVKVSVRHLFAPTESEAENLYRLVKMGVSFKELAKQVFSDTTLRNNGGNLGYITWGETDPNFESAAYSLKIGEVSRPVKTAQGYSIIKVDDRIEDPFTTETEFLNRKNKLERTLKIDKKLPYEKAYLGRVFDTTKVKFNEKALEAVFNDLQNMGNHSIESNDHLTKSFQYCVQYNKKKYSAKDIENKMLEVPQYSRNVMTNVKRLKDAVLGLLMQDVLLDIAKEKGYDTTSYVTETFDNLANNIYLNYKRNEVLALVPVADSEIARYYKQNIAHYSNEPEMNVQEIVVESDSLASTVREKIELGEDFGSLAVKYSLRTWSAKNEGIMGLSPVSNYGELKDTLWSSDVGKVIGPLAFDKYFGIFRVLDKKNGDPIDISAVRPQIVKAIENEKGFPYMKRRLEGLSKLTTIKVYDDLVKNYTMNLPG
ncbi:MAG: peptidylprolyl isomerase [Bacteroidota bacterium]